MAEPPPTACIVAHVNLAFEPKPPLAAPPIEPNGTTEGVSGWVQVSTGKRCRDGADLLEGRIDDYTDCDEATSLCSLTRKCQAKCSKRAACRFYTTWPTGYCELSSHCEDEAQAGDPTSRTFRKAGAAGQGT